MQVCVDTTVKSILDQYPEVIGIFEKHGVDVPLECDESILDTELEICEGMCHIDDLDGLMRDLQAYINERGG